MMSLLQSLRRARTATALAAALVLVGIGAGGASAADLTGLWASKAGSAFNVDNGYSTSAVPGGDGSAIVVGVYSGSGSYPARFGTQTLPNYGGARDLFVAKVGASGAWEWVASAGGLTEDYGYGVSAFADGSAIVTGSYTGTATFGSHTLTAAGSADIFVAKISAAGVWDWAKSAGGGQYDVAYAATTFSDGSAMITGLFSSATATFPDSLSLTQVGSNPNTFVAKVSSGGTFAWVRGASGADSILSSPQAANISGVDSDGSAIVVGTFSGTAAFPNSGGPAVPDLTATGSSDVFVAKIDSTGVWQWSTKAGGTAPDRAFGVSSLADGSAFVVGSYISTATFGSTTLPAATIEDVFVAKVDANGTFAWATGAGGVGNDNDAAYAVTANPDGSAFVTGRFAGTIRFPNGSGSAVRELTATGLSDVFAAKIDASGTFLAAEKAGSTSNDEGFGISTRPDGSALVTGNFRDTATFFSPAVTLTPDSASQDIFVSRVTVTGPPGAPSAVTATAGDGQVAVSWGAPVSDGGSAITGYTVTTTPTGGSCAWSSGPLACTVTGLTNGTAYTISVTATNALGTSSATVSSAVTPTAASAPSPETPSSGAPPSPAASGVSASAANEPQDPSAPSLVGRDGDIVEVPSGEGRFIYSNGVVRTADVEITKTASGPKMDVSGTRTGFEMDLRGAEPRAAVLDPVSQRIVFTAGKKGIATGRGFKPGSRAEVWLFSEPRFLGYADVAADGSFTKQFTLPDDIVIGDHTVQTEGVAKNGSSRAVSAGVLVRKPEERLRVVRRVVVFGPDSAGLTPAFRRSLARLAGSRVVSVSVDGFVHATPSRAGDRQLSRQRALAVAGAIKRADRRSPAAQRAAAVRYTVRARGRTPARSNSICANWLNRCAIVTVMAKRGPKAPTKGSTGRTDEPMAMPARAPFGK